MQTCAHGYTAATCNLAPGRAASGGALAPEPPRATRSTPESILNLSQKTLFFDKLQTGFFGHFDFNRLTSHESDFSLV